MTLSDQEIKKSNSILKIILEKVKMQVCHFLTHYEMKIRREREIKKGGSYVYS